MTRSYFARTGSALALAAGLCLALPPASADVVTTRDGLALEGTAAKQADGAWRVETPDGVVTLPAASVVNVVPGPGPRSAFLAKAARVPEGDAAGQYRLGLEAESAGLRDL